MKLPFSVSAQRTIINLAQALAPYWKSLHQLAMFDGKYCTVGAA